MLFRLFISFLALAAVASFGFGFWLVLRPSNHHWEVDIPLDRRLPPKKRTPNASAADPAANLSIDPIAEPPVDAKALIEAMEPGGKAGTAIGPRPITLSLPIACELGNDCWVVNYVDVDPGEGRADYRCNEMSYDGHKGTDIGLANEARVADNVPVLAAAGGKVVGTRDGEPDAGSAGMGRAREAGRECGNGVRIDHGDGWATQYCHMREGSVLVQTGQEVEAGQILGAVGLSGLTQFPHIHLSVSRGSEVVDPFRGVAGGPDCAVGIQPLWDDETLTRLLALDPPVLLDVAFSDGVPTPADAEKGEAAWDAFGPETGAVVVWFRAAGVEPGDTAQVTIRNPDGSIVFNHTDAFESIQSATFRGYGVKNNANTFPDGLPPGEWTGSVVVRRDGKVTDSRDVTVTVFVGRGDG